MYASMERTDGALERELQPGETVFWQGRPNLWATAKTDQAQIWVGLIAVLVGLGYFLPPDNDYIVANLPEGLFGFFFCSLFILAGVAAIAGRVRAILATRFTVYAVTNLRLLIVTNLRRRTVVTVAPSAINVVEVSEKADGSGSVTFRREVRDTGDGRETVKLAFLGIPDVRQAALQIEKLRRDPLPAKPV